MGHRYKYHVINKAVVMSQLTGDFNMDSNAYAVPAGLSLALYVVICPTVTVSRINPTWSTPGLNPA